MSTIGFIGLGAMGSRIATRLMEAGTRCTGPTARLPRHGR